MSCMMLTEISTGLAVIVALLVVVVCLILYVQYRLCIGIDGKKRGLVLPIVSLMVALMISLCISVLSSARKTGVNAPADVPHISVEGIEETVTDYEAAADAETGSSYQMVEVDCDMWTDFLIPFLIVNVPTVILLIEYFVFAGKSRKDERKVFEV